MRSCERVVDIYVQYSGDEGCKFEDAQPQLGWHVFRHMTGGPPGGDLWKEPIVMFCVSNDLHVLSDERIGLTRASPS